MYLKIHTYLSITTPPFRQLRLISAAVFETPPVPDVLCFGDQATADVRQLDPKKERIKKKVLCFDHFSSGDFSERTAPCDVLVLVPMCTAS